ncbi:MAG: crosslink repair DNA glycosylase YcaQ family protein [Pseudomonadota bacterium]
MSWGDAEEGETMATGVFLAHKDRFDVADMTAELKIRNRDARRLLLNAQGLAAAPTGALDLSSVIRSLGFVQLDTIQVIARAHHHILWSRNQHYRERMLDAYLAKHRLGFEHFTHDASIIPVEFYPMWTRQFQRLEKKVRQWGWGRGVSATRELSAVRDRITREGPLSTKDFDSKVNGERKMWDRPPHKRALDYLWYTGELTTSHRENFTKYYDLTERVIPAEFTESSAKDADQVDWLCQSAIERLAFGSIGDIQRFWDAVDNAEAKDWVQHNETRLVPVAIEDANGEFRSAYAPRDVEARLAAARAPTSRLRIMNPFDPLIRDRVRLERLFGFEYRVEMFVPQAKRRWGYYVYPLLEGDRFVGRLEAKANRKTGCLTVTNLWPEAGVKWTNARYAKLEAELARLAKLVGADDVVLAGQARTQR